MFYAREFNNSFQMKFSATRKFVADAIILSKKYLQRFQMCLSLSMFCITVSPSGPHRARPFCPPVRLPVV